MRFAGTGHADLAIGRGAPIGGPRLQRWALNVVAPTAVGGAVGAAAAVAASERSPRALLVALALVAPFAVALAGGLRRVLLGLALLDIPFQWDKYFGYRDDVAALAALGGWGVSAMTLALAGLYGMWIARLLVSPETAWRPRLRAAALPVTFVAILIASLTVAQDRTVAGFQIAMYVQMLLLFVYVASTVRTRAELRFVVIMLLVGLVLECLVTLAMYASGGAFQVPGLLTESAPATGGTGASRAAGTIVSPNNAGAYFAFMLALAAAVFLSGVDARLRRLALVACVLAPIALALTLSRGAWIAALVSIAILVHGSRGRRLTPPAVVALILVLILVLVPLQGVITARLVNSDQGAAAGRVPLIQMAGEMIRDHPILGVGANNFVLEVPEYAAGRFSSAWLSTVHHKYLLIWAEAGLAALLTFLAFLWTTIVRGWRLRRASDPLVGAVGLGLAAAVAGHAVQMNFEIFAGGTTIAMLWVAAAIVASPVLEAARRAG
jgi:O-antigen ligase